MEDNQCTNLASCAPHENCTQCTPKGTNDIECLACKKSTQDPKNNCKEEEQQQTKKKTGFFLDLEEKPICDPKNTPEVIGKNCKSCDPISFECTQCYTQDNRYIKEG